MEWPFVWRTGCQKAVWPSRDEPFGSMLCMCDSLVSCSLIWFLWFTLELQFLSHIHCYDLLKSVKQLRDLITVWAATAYVAKLNLRSCRLGYVLSRTHPCIIVLTILWSVRHYRYMWWVWIVSAEKWSFILLLFLQVVTCFFVLEEEPSLENSEGLSSLCLWGEKFTRAFYGFMQFQMPA